MTKLFSEVILNVLIKPRLMIKCKVVLNCKSVLHGYKVNLNSGFCEHLVVQFRPKQIYVEVGQSG